MSDSPHDGEHLAERAVLLVEPALRASASDSLPARRPTFQP